MTTIEKSQRTPARVAGAVYVLGMVAALSTRYAYDNAGDPQTEK